MRAAICILLAGCGLVSPDKGGGSEHLPISPAGPYKKLVDDPKTPLPEPYIITELGTDLRDPSPLVAGDGWRVWYTRTAKNSPSEIWSLTWPTLRTKPTGMQRVLAADQAWEQGAVRAPCVRETDAGFVMFYEAGGAIGRATSTDGTSWTKDPAPVLTTGEDPTAAQIEGRWFLYFTRPDAPGIFVATSDDGKTFTAMPDPVLQRRDMDALAFDRERVAEPDAIGLEPTGEPEIGLFYVGSDPYGLDSIGYAGSRDGLHFVRFGDGTKPILDKGQPSEWTPGVAFSGDHSLLLFGQEKANVSALAAATAP